MDEIRTEFRRPYRRGRRPPLLRQPLCASARSSRNHCRCPRRNLRRTAARTAERSEQGQFAAEALQHHLGRVAVLPGLILPFACLQRAFDVTFEPFFRYCSAILHRFSLKITTRCHSVFSLRSPVDLSRHESEVAMRKIGDRPAVLSPANFRIAPRCRSGSLCSRFLPSHAPFAQRLRVVVTVLPGLSPARPIEPLSAFPQRLAARATAAALCSYFVPNQNARFGLNHSPSEAETSNARTALCPIPRQAPESSPLWHLGNIIRCAIRYLLGNRNMGGSSFFRPPTRKHNDSRGIAVAGETQK